MARYHIKDGYMKKFFYLILATCVFGLLFVGCADRYANPESRELVVFNDTTDQIIDNVAISSYLSPPRAISANALAEGETIQPGERKAFYLPPYPDYTTIRVDSSPEDNSVDNYANDSLNMENYVLDTGAVVEAGYYYDTDSSSFQIEFGGDGYQNAK